MEFKQVIKEADCNTAAADVQGLPKRLGAVVRRKLPIEPVNIVVYAKKKKKKKKKE